MSIIHDLLKTIKIGSSVIRLASQAVSGGALNVDGSMLHLCALPVHSEQVSNRPERFRSRMQRPSIRRHNY